MPNLETRIGVPSILISLDSSTALPALTSITFSASAITPTDYLLNDVTPNLSTSDTYQVILGLVGRDTTNGGYSVTRCSPGSGIVSITSGQMIQVKCTTANQPSNWDKAVAVAVFLKINNDDFQLAQFSFIEAGADFSTVIAAKPLRVAPRFTAALLQSTTTDTTLGDRAPLGFTYEEITPTTGVFNFRRPVSNVTVSPNTGADFQVATTRSVNIRFESLVNNVKEWVRAGTGNYVKYTDTYTYEEAQQSLNTAQALLRGNRPIQVVMPADPFGFQETRLLIGNLTVNQTELEEAWSKTATTNVTFQFDSSSLDRLITNQHTEISYKRRTS